MLLTKFSNTTFIRRGIANKKLQKLLQNSQSMQSAAIKMKSETPTTSATTALNGVAAPARPVKLNKQQADLQLRREKQALKKKTVSYIPGTVNLQILGTGSNGAPSGVYLFTDQSRYLFNCGEGTQRLAHEHKTKLSRLEQIFVTRNTWSMVGGFPGLALTVQDAGVRELSLHGPPYLNDILQSMKRFVVLKNLQVNTKDCTEEQYFEDDVMSVKCLPLKNHNDTAKSVIAYICKLKPKPGALNLIKCVEHGVPPGPLLGMLKNGKDVTLDCGKVVRSKDVSEPSEQPMAFIFLDIPSVDYLPELQAHSKDFHELASNNNDVKQETVLVVHFSPMDIVQNNCYQNFTEQFPKSTQHVYLNSGKGSFSGYMATHRIQYQLNLLNERIFPLLAEAKIDGEYVSQSNGLSNKLKKTKLEEPAEKPKLEENGHQQLNEESVSSMSNFHLRPRKGFDHTLSAKLTPLEYIQETQQLEKFPMLLAELRAAYKALPPPEPSPEYPKITFLGTGSCIPNKTRNVSAILLQPAIDSYMLMDCGEGTLGQIIRFFGQTQAEDVIRNLHAIYISHLHADHHIGLIALLNERQRLLGDEATPLLLFAPTHLISWLRFYDERIESISGAYELISNARMLSEPMELVEKYPHLGISSIATCLVRHCPHSYGVSLKLTSQYNEKPVKLTYSGDTMPCNDLVDLGFNSTILIHEATMEDDLIDEAKFKMHSTISQAIQQGKDMKAEHVILTHFSQRYAKLPRMQSTSSEENEEQTMQNIAIAFDNMQVSIGDLKHFHLMYPALRALFAEHAEELEQKAIKRELKLERKRKLNNTD